MVKQIAVSAENDGEETWRPERKDVGDNLYVEVGCASSEAITNGCSSDLSDGKIAIRNTFGSNIAGAFQSFLDLFKNLFK